MSDEFDNKIGKLFIDPDEELSFNELKNRWKAKAPSSNLYILAAVGFVAGILFAIGAASPRPLWFSVISIALGFLTNVWQNFQLGRRSNERILAEIKTMREIHAEDDLP